MGRLECSTLFRTMRNCTLKRTDTVIRLFSFSNPVLWICSSLLATIDAYLTMPADFHPVTCMKSGEGIKPPLCIQEETRE
jgi:hypothetical protein